MLIGYAWNQELYGNQRNETFDDIFPSLDDFKKEYTECKLPLTEYFGDVSSEQVSTLYYLLYGKYGNSTIASDDETRFQYSLFSIVFQYGPTWVEQLKLQKEIRNLTLQELQTGGKAIYNTALNPNVAPTTSALEELPYINQQNTTNYAKSKADAYELKMNLLSSDVTEKFLGKFRKLFLKIVQPTVPLWYITDETEENENV